MSKKNNSKVEMHLTRGFFSLAPDDPNSVWDQPVEAAVGSEWYLEGIEKPKRRAPAVVAFLSAAAACVALFFFLQFNLALRTAATIYLDINPSIELQVNRQNKVLSAEAKNPDGEIILEDMDLKNTDLNLTINALIGSMVKHGYLNEAQNMILVSVDSADSQKASELRTQLSEEIEDCLITLIGSGTVFDQEVEDDDELEKLAQEYGITPGKVALIQKLVALNPELDPVVLAKLSITELAIQLKKSGIDLRNYTNYTSNGHGRQANPEFSGQEPQTQVQDTVSPGTRAPAPASTAVPPTAKRVPTAEDDDWDDDPEDNDNDIDDIDWDDDTDDMDDD
ncbi:MAG: hypothetical protein IIY71_02170 [Oscillospiraceae bacterium]|nr:hypothetical protein [Oscillospiraceae bacterium]